MRLEIYSTAVLHETDTTQGNSCMVCYPAGMTAHPPTDPAAKKIRITIDGKIALTVEMLADRWGVATKTVSSALSRDGIEHDGMLDKQKKLYLQTKSDSWWKNRPGKGWKKASS